MEPPSTSASDKDAPKESTPQASTTSVGSAPAVEAELSNAGRSAGWKLLWGSVKEQRLGIFLGMLIALIWTVGRVAIPLLVQAGIDRGIEGDDSATKWALYVVGAGVLSGIFLGLRRYVAFHNARIVEARMRDRLFAHIQRLHFAFHDANATGDLMSRANTDLQQYQNIITIIPLITGNLLTVIAVTIIMVWVQPLLAVLALSSLPFVNWLGKRFAQKLHPSVMGIQRESANLATVVEETVTGVRVMKGFGAEDVQRDKLSGAADEVYRHSMAASMTRSRYGPAMEIMPNLGLIVVLGFGGHLVLDGQMTVGELVSFNIYVMLLVQPLRMLGVAVANGQRAAAAGERINEILSTSPSIVAPTKPLALPATGPRGKVVFDNVTFGYQPDDTIHQGEPNPVLVNLSFEIQPGESVAIVGATGSGKSTIANLLPRFYDVDSGTISLDGVDVRNLRPQDLRREVGLVFEETFLFNATIRDNIAYANPDASQEDVELATTLAGADFIADLPASYGTEIGERGFSLSGGQRQRLAIARALLANPRVLILDDATSAVDPTKEHEIRDALAVAMDKRTTIVIAHRPGTIALADRVIVLDEGQVVAEGAHADLMANNARYRELLAAEEVPSVPSS